MKNVLNPMEKILNNEYNGTFILQRWKWECFKVCWRNGTRGIANQIREEPGNLKYEYFQSLNDSQTILLVDSWQNQEALDIHHVSNMMNEIMRLRNKYNLHVKAERFVPDNFSLNDKKYIKE